MAYELIIRPEAEQDLDDAFAWYEEKRQGLGHDFLLQINAGLRLLERSPLIFAEQYKGIRRHLIRRFPYKIFYRVDDRKVIVLAAIYGGRDPQWIRKRLQRPYHSE